MVDYDVMVFIRYKYPINCLCDDIIWSNNESEIGIIPISLYKKLRELIIGKSIIDLAEIQLIKMRKA